MNSRQKILDGIYSSSPSTIVDLPDTNISHVSYENKNKQFSNILKSVGGYANWLENDSSIGDFVKNSYDNLGMITTNLDLSIDYIKTNDIDDPHALKNIDLAVLKGEFAVAENGAVWIKEENNIHRAVYFIAKKLLIIVKKENIVDSMHEAYEKIDFSKNGFGIFISGPSKTADIEQSLVIGAHGAMECRILFI